MTQELVAVDRLPHGRDRETFLQESENSEPR